MLKLDHVHFDLIDMLRAARPHLETAMELGRERTGRIDPDIKSLLARIDRHLPKSTPMIAPGCRTGRFHSDIPNHSNPPRRS